jgi:hypothetical protein
VRLISSRVLFHRDMQDRHADPGRFSSTRDARGQTRLRLEGCHAWLIGEGYSAEGQVPFVDRIDLSDEDTERRYPLGLAWTR